MLPAYVSASSDTTSCGVAASRCRTTFDEMKPGAARHENALAHSSFSIV